MKHLMLIFIPLFLVCSCSKEDQKGQVLPAFVSNVIIPLSTTIGDSTPVYVQAYAPNGCWYNIRINLNETLEYHYEITATGVFNGNLVCSDVIIEGDTTFYLTFDTIGKYYFQSNRSPFEIRYDTITVVNE